MSGREASFAAGYMRDPDCEGENGGCDRRTVAESCRGGQSGGGEFDEIPTLVL